MTKESKLALIIGFVLVLVVGVLVSDHFSQANSMLLESQAPEQDQLASPIHQLGQRSIADQSSASSQQSALNQNQDRNSFMTARSNQGEPVMIRNGRSRYASAQQDDSIIDQAFNEGRRLLNETQLPQAAVTKKQPEVQQPIRRIPEQNKQQYRTYKVVAGDTLIKIARQQLQDGDRWIHIHKLNADKLGPDAILKIGMILKIPADSSSLITRKAPAKTYTVVAGDTLGQISARLLGTSKRVNEFVELNGLEDADDIRVGMTLKVPAK